MPIRIKWHWFTLIEIMIVIAIIGILGMTLFPAINNYQMRARDSVRMVDFKSIKNAISAYKIDTDNYVRENGIYMDTSQWATFAGPWTGTGPWWTDWHTNWLRRLEWNYIKNLPKDPVNKWIYFYSYEPVDNQTDYGVSCVWSVCAYILSAKLENSNNGLANLAICNIVWNGHDYCLWWWLPNIYE